MALFLGGQTIGRRWAKLAIITVLILTSRQGYAAIAVDSQSSGNTVWTGPTPTALAFSHTTTGSNTLLIVAVSLNVTNNTTTTVSSVTYGASSLTLIAAGATGNRRVEYWKLPNAPAGTATVTVTPSAVANARRVGVVADAITFTGVDTTVPVGTPSFTGATSAAPSLTVASNANQIILDTVAATGYAGGTTTTISMGPGQTQEWNVNTGQSTAQDVVASGSIKNGAGSVTMSETLNQSVAWEIGALPIYGAATGSLCATPGKDGVGSIAGAVNSYYAPTVGTTLTPGKSSVSLTAAAVGANVNINAGDLLLIMQMQDANINSTNTSAYGAGTTTGSGYTALNSAGLYEFVVANNTVTFGTAGTLNFSGIGPGGGVVNTYTEAAYVAGTKGQSTFQVIRVPQYTSATLGNGGNVAVATAWNGTVGGVFAIDVEGILTLNGTVNVDALGFRGAGGRVLAGGTGASTDYVTLSTNATNGSKGEGIAGTPMYVISSAGALVTNANEGLPNGSYARGAPGNAGGGGTDGNPPANDENSGGGGGGNGGAGGMGGDSWNANTVSGGLGGVAFPATVSRVTMGGGGGAGTTNNGTSDPNTNTTGINSSGGTGGGLVMIRTSEVTGTGTISANGATTLNTQNDSTGGGGAGGTVIVVAQHTSPLSGLTVSAVGGKGGTAWATSGPGTPCPGGSACNYHGPGGGGGGGVVILSSAATSTNVSGGLNGTTTTSAVAYGATAGSAGTVTTNATLAGMGGASSGSACVPDLTIAGAGLTSGVRGSTWNYALTVSNLGIQNTSGQVIVNDPLPFGLTLTSTSGTGWSCTQTSQDVTCTRSDALAGFGAAYPVINLAGSVTQTAPSSPTNTATTSGGGETYLGNDSTSVTSNIVSSADLVLTSAPNPNTVAPNGVLAFTQTVTNAGPSDATGLFFTSTIPANTTFQSLTVPSGWSCTTPAIGATGTISCAATALVSGGSATFTLITSVNNGVADGTVLTNTASVSSFTPDPNGYNNSLQTKATVKTSPGAFDLALTDVASPATAAVGSQITFNHVLTNTGGAASALSFTENLPANTTLVSAPSPSGWSCSGTTTFTCTIASLASGAAVSFPLTVQITSGTTISDSATITSSPADAYTTNNTATATVSVVASGADIGVTTQASPVSTIAGNNVVFSHTIVNNGPNTSGTITLTETLTGAPSVPAGTAFANIAAPSGWVCTPAFPSVSCTGSGLAVGATATIQVTTSVPGTAASGTVLTDSVSVAESGGVTDPVAGNNSATATSTITNGTDVGVSVVSGTPDPVLTTGGALAITYQVVNNGPGNSGSTTFIVSVPTNATYVSLAAPSSGATWTCNPPSGGSVLCTVPDLAVGYSGNFTLNLTTGALTANTPITSNATVITNAISDKVPENNAATFTTVVTAASQADLALTLTSSPVPVTAGNQITLTGTATNKGPANAANPKYTMVLPAGTSFVSSTLPGCSVTAGTLTCGSANSPFSSTPGLNTENFTITLATASSVSAGTSIPTTLTFSSTTNGPSGSAASVSATASTTVVTSADLSVANSCTADQLPSSNIVCTQTITDLGPSDAQGVVFTESIPANTTLVTVSGPSCSFLAGLVTCNPGTVAVGTPVTITFTTKVNAGVTRGTKISDTVNVTTTTSDPVSSNNAATATTTVLAAGDSDLGVTNSAPSSVSAGSTITYTQNVTNNGVAAVGPQTVTETVPTNSTFSSINSTSWTCSGQPAVGGTGTFTCSLASGVTSTPITFVVTANAGLAAGTVITDVLSTPFASGTDPDSTNNTATANTTIANSSQADVKITSIAASNNSPRTGTSDTFTIVATNAGPATATNTVVTIPIPNLEQFVSVTPGANCSVNGATVTCLLGTLTSGSSSTITLVVNAINLGLTSNSATVVADQTDPNTANNTASIPILVLSPTEVKLTAFEAVSGNGRVVLQWRTKEEIRNLGFNVYREVSGERVKLNPSLIAGSTVRMRSYLPQHTASAYTWTDESPTAGATYWLEDISLSGSRTIHGPVQAAGTAQHASGKVARSVLLSHLNIAAQAPVPPSSTTIVPVVAAAGTIVIPQDPANTGRSSRGQRSADAMSSAALSGLPAVKIAINHEGWYRVTAAQLVAAGLGAMAKPESLRLVSEGVEVPMSVNSSGDTLNGIEFYGIGLDDPYTDTRMYWLIWNGPTGQRLHTSELSSSSLPAATGYMAEAVRQDRSFYFAALTNNGDNDNFFGDVVSSTPVDEHIQVTGIDANNSSTAQLDVTLQGITDPAGHDVQVSLNGVLIGEIVFSDMGHGALVTTVPINLLHEGDNVVTLNPLGGDDDVTTVDHVIISYQRRYLADGDQLRFTVLGQSSVKLTGFTNADIHVMEIGTTMSTAPISVAQDADGSYSATMTNRDAAPGVYYAYAGDVVATPSTLTAHAATSLSAAANAADLLIVSHRSFIPALTPLVTLRGQQGVNAKIVDVEDVYDEFNYGEHSPYALRSFLQTAVNDWTTAPRWLLLVGDASVDPRNYLAFGSFDFVPTKIVPTAQLKTASDGWFTDFNQTGLEQIATGRLAARTPADAATMVGKIVAYDAQPPGAWSNTALLIADQNDGADFQGETATIVGMLPAQLTTSTLDVTAPATDHVTLLDQLNSGKLIVNYLGHGSVDVWSNDGFFTSADAQALTNGGLTPFFIGMDCLNGFFHDVYQTSLAETLLLNPQGGAVAVWASSGLTDPEPQFGMDGALMQYLFANPAQTIGDATRSAKQGVTDADVRRTWILFGDPSQKLKFAVGN